MLGENGPGIYQRPFKVHHRRLVTVDGARHRLSAMDHNAACSTEMTLDRDRHVDRGLPGSAQAPRGQRAHVAEHHR